MVRMSAHYLEILPEKRLCRAPMGRIPDKLFHLTREKLPFSRVDSTYPAPSWATFSSSVILPRRSRSRASTGSALSLYGIPLFCNGSLHAFLESGCRVRLVSLTCRSYIRSPAAQHAAVEHVASARNSRGKARCASCEEPALEGQWRIWIVNSPSPRPAHGESAASSSTCGSSTASSRGSRFPPRGRGGCPGTGRQVVPELEHRALAPFFWRKLKSPL